MITEALMALGQWSLTLRPDTPQELLDAMSIDTAAFGHVIVHPVPRLDPEYIANPTGTGLFLSSRYVGVYRKLESSDAGYTLSGVGMAFWLGDDDGKGPLIETAVSLSGKTLHQCITALLPAAVTEGTITNPSGTFSGQFQWVTPRDAITYVCQVLSTAANGPVEWRVQGDGTITAGTISNLGNSSTPTAMVTRHPGGKDAFTAPIVGSTSRVADVEDYATRVVLLAEGTGAAIKHGSASLGSTTPYNDIHGNSVVITRTMTETGTTPSNAATRAKVALDAYTAARNTVTLSSDEYDIKNDFDLGDYIYVWDPDAGFSDITVGLNWKGEIISPVKLRVVETTYPIEDNWTVWFRDASGTLWDLTPYYVPDTGSTDIVVGAQGTSVTAAASPTVASPAAGPQVLGAANVRMGTITITVTGGVVSSGHVTHDEPFPTGLTYGCVVSANTTVPGSTVEEVSYSGIDNTGFDVNIFRTTSVNTGVSYIAFAF